MIVYSRTLWTDLRHEDPSGVVRVGTRSVRSRPEADPHPGRNVQFVAGRASRHRGTEFTVALRAHGWLRWLLPHLPRSSRFPRIARISCQLWWTLSYQSSPRLCLLTGRAPRRMQP